MFRVNFLLPSTASTFTDHLTALHLVALMTFDKHYKLEGCIMLPYHSDCLLAL